MKTYIYMRCTSVLDLYFGCALISTQLIQKHPANQTHHHTHWVYMNFRATSLSPCVCVCAWYWLRSVGVIRIISSLSSCVFGVECVECLSMISLQAKTQTHIWAEKCRRHLEYVYIIIIVKWITPLQLHGCVFFLSLCNILTRINLDIILFKPTGRRRRMIRVMETVNGECFLGKVDCIEKCLCDFTPFFCCMIKNNYQYLFF